MAKTTKTVMRNNPLFKFAISIHCITSRFDKRDSAIKYFQEQENQLIQTDVTIQHVTLKYNFCSVRSFFSSQIDQNLN